MQGIAVLIVSLVLALPTIASGQSFELYGAAGPTLTDPGSSVAVGGGFSPRPWLTVAFSVERTQLSTQTTFDEQGRILSSFRGGTMYLGTGEVRFTPFGPDRLGPYGLAGLAAGVSRPHVTARHPDRVTNDVRAVLAGGGLQVPLRGRLALFAEARMMLGAEGIEGIVAVAPLRAGVTWRF